MPDPFAFLETIASPTLPRKVRGFLDLIFVGSIASFCFELAYFEYRLIDFLNYEQIYRFFISGHFIIPFSIFYFVWWVTDIAGASIFKKPNDFLRKSVATFFLNFLKKKWKARDRAADSTEERSYQRFEKTHNSKKSIKQELAEKIKIEKEFILLLRGLIASIIYFVEIPYFGGTTFAIIIMMIFASALMLILKYQAFQIFHGFVVFLEDDTNQRMKSKKIIMP